MAQNDKYLNTIGSFECVVNKPEAGWFGESKEKKTPFVRLPLTVREGEHKGKITVWSGWLSEAAFDNTIAALSVAFKAWDGDINSIDKGALVGLPCSITMEAEEYEGKTRFKAKWLNPPGGGAPKEMEPEKRISLLAKLAPRGRAIAKDARAKAAAETAGKPISSSAPANTAAATTEPEDDDVPF